MNIKLVLRIVAYILLLEIALMVPGCLISVVDGEWGAVKGFLWTFLIIAVTACLILILTRKAVRGKFYSREGLVTTGLTWIAMSALGCLPFVISGEIPNFIDAMFEMVSGFTTTGSSILVDVEAMRRGLLWWRSFSHWIGGMGVLVFLMAIVSLGGRNSGFTMHIMRAESPGPASGKIVPRMKDTEKITYLIYTGMTILNIVLLIVIGKMPVFDACCIAFGTAGTGGFGIKADSMASYTPAAQNITTIFMLLFSVNFSIYYLLLMRKFKDAFFDEEFRLFWFIVIASIVLICFNVRFMYGSLEETVRHSAFTVGTIISTTGYATTDFDLWPSFSKTILLFLMFCGACAGSTGGGIKQVRLLILFKSLRRNIHKFLHPSEVNKIGYNGRVMDEQIVSNINAYLIAYVVIVILSVLILSLDGFDFESNFSAVMATFNNIGPGLAKVGPTQNFFSYSYLSKIVMIFDMLAGRLEIMPIIVLFSRSTWKKAR
jgi:trk system potassium uptake protein TrkH